MTRITEPIMAGCVGAILGGLGAILGAVAVAALPASAHQPQPIVQVEQPPEFIVEHGDDDECWFLWEIYNESGHICYNCGDGLWIPIVDWCTIPPEPGDLNGDGYVNLADYAIFLPLWQAAEPADFSSDDGTDTHSPGGSDNPGGNNDPGGGSNDPGGPGENPGGSDPTGDGYGSDGPDRDPDEPD